MKLQANNPIYLAVEEAFKSVGRKQTKEETIKSMMEYSRHHVKNFSGMFPIPTVGYPNAAKAYLRSIGVKFDEDKQAPFINPFTKKVESSVPQKLEALTRLAASRFGRFNPTQMEDEGMDEDIIAELKAFNSKIAFTGVDFSQEAVEILIHAAETSQTDRSDKVFSADQLVLIGQFIAKISKDSKVFSVETAISEDKKGLSICVALDS